MREGIFDTAIFPFVKCGSSGKDWKVTASRHNNHVNNLVVIKKKNGSFIKIHFVQQFQEEVYKICILFLKTARTRVRDSDSQHIRLSSLKLPLLHKKLPGSR